MPLKKNTYRVYKVAILEESWVNDMIEQDAINSSMPDHVNKLLALRVTEYYQLIRDGVISAAMLGSIDVAARSTNGGSRANGSAATPKRDQQRRPAPAARESSEEEQSRSVALSDDTDDNADAALDFFVPLEEEEEQET
jgi:hypothetical protein